jgi:predicted RNase H-like nuclease (RuvC/YqgF family)
MLKRNCARLRRALAALAWQNREIENIEAKIMAGKRNVTNHNESQRALKERKWHQPAIAW